MTQPLSPQQTHALVALRDAGPMSTAAFVADVKTLDGDVFTVDQARNLLSRLERRGAVFGDGVGQQRMWTVVPEAAASLPGAPASLNGASSETGVRAYEVLEELTLAGLVEEIATDSSLTLDPALREALEQHGVVYDPVGRPEARNTEHALRIVAKEHPGYEDPELQPRMVAVATRMFQVEPVTVTNRREVSIGGRRG